MSLPDDTPSGAQGWFINTRRPKFADPRLREALCDAFDFEWTNKTIMYGAYERTISVFQNSDMMADGPPSPDEVTLLAPSATASREVFGEPYVPPVSDGTGQDRELLRKGSHFSSLPAASSRTANARFAERRADRIEFLLDEPAFEPHHMPFIKNLATLGIDATIRLVDPVQYRARRDGFDFDIAIDRFGFSLDTG